MIFLDNREIRARTDQGPVSRKSRELFELFDASRQVAIDLFWKGDLLTCFLMNENYTKGLRSLMAENLIAEKI